MSAVRRVTVLLTMAVAALAFAACSIGGPEVSSRARCDGPAFTSETMPETPQRTLIIVDLADNDESARERIVEAIDPVVSRAVAEGGVVRLLVSGGEGQSLSVSHCLDGATTIMVDRNNDETQRRAQDTAVNAIEGDVSALLEETRVSPRGDLSNELAAIPVELRSLSGDRDPVSVVVISDLNSPAAKGDCLSLNGVRAGRAVAEAMVERCLETDQFRSLPAGVEMRIVRPQLLPGDSATARMSGYLMASLCTQMTEERGGCTSESAGEG